MGLRRPDAAGEVSDEIEAQSQSLQVHSSVPAARLQPTTIRSHCNGRHSKRPNLTYQGIVMSLATKADIYQKQVERANAKSQSRGFILTLVCIALFLLFVSLIFPPSTSDSGQTNAVWLVGP